MAHSHSWKSKGSKPIENIEKVLQDTASDPVHPRFQLDTICVADLACWKRSIVSAYRADWNPTNQASLTQVFGASVGPMTSMICGSDISQAQKPSFRPVGALLDDLTRRIGHQDASARDIADYFSKADLGGAGQGTMRPWPISVYSPGVAQQIIAGRMTNGDQWNPWSIAF